MTAWGWLWVWGCAAPLVQEDTPEELLTQEPSSTSPNEAPFAEAGEDASVVAGDQVPLDGTASFDPDDDPLAHAWAVVERPAGAMPTLLDGDQALATFVPDVAGIYTARLAVTDGQSVSRDEVVITAQAPEPTRAMMWVQDLSCSMVSDTPPAIDPSRAAAWTLAQGLLDEAAVPTWFGVTGFAQWAPQEGGGIATTEEGPDNLYAQPPPLPWAQLTLLEADADVQYLFGRISAICAPEGCPDDPFTATTISLVPPTPDIGVCSNPQVGLLQATELLKDVPGAFFKGIMVVLHGAPNCEGEQAGAIQAADAAYNEHDIHIWAIDLLPSGGLFGQKLARGIGSGAVLGDPQDLALLMALLVPSIPSSAAEVKEQLGN